MNNLANLEASVEVEIVDGVWFLVMRADKIKFKESEPLPEGFDSFNPQRQKYWSNKIFSLLEKRLSHRIKVIEASLRGLRILPPSTH